MHRQTQMEGQTVFKYRAKLFHMEDYRTVSAV